MPKSTPKLLSVAEVAAELSLTPRTIQYLCDRSEVPGAQRVGRSWVIPREAVASIPVRRPGRPGKAG